MLAALGSVGVPNVKSTRIRYNNNNWVAGRRRIEHLGMLVNCGEDSQVAASYASASSCKLLPQLAVVLFKKMIPELPSV